MKAATYANVRTTEAARAKGKAQALVMALDGGAVMGLCVAGLGLIGLGVFYYLFAQDIVFESEDGIKKLATVLHSFAVGASSIALFARIGGGIYTKAADVGADIVGKVEANIPEDDPRNPGVIADNVGDNVGDIAGMGADIYESLRRGHGRRDGARADACPSTLLHEKLAPGIERRGRAARCGRGAARPALHRRPRRLDRRHLHHAHAQHAAARHRAAPRADPAAVPRDRRCLPRAAHRSASRTAAVWTLAAGALGGAIIGLVTDYYTSMGPIRKIAEASLTGPGTNVIRGLAVGMESCAVPLLTLVIVGYVSNHFLGLYGIALAPSACSPAPPS